MTARIGATIIATTTCLFFNNDSNNFATTLRADGSFTTVYGAVSTQDAIAGTTEGNGAADPGETDLSAGGPFPAAGTTYEAFFGDQDLSGLTLDFNP